MLCLLTSPTAHIHPTTVPQTTIKQGGDEKFKGEFFVNTCFLFSNSKYNVLSSFKTQMCAQARRSKRKRMRRMGKEAVNLPVQGHRPSRYPCAAGKSSYVHFATYHNHACVSSFSTDATGRIAAAW